MKRRSFVKALSIVGFVGFVGGNFAFFNSMRKKRQELHLAPAEDDVDVVSIAFSFDSSRLASVTADGLLSIWDPATGNRLSTVPAGHSGTFTGISFLSKDSWLATAASGDRAVKFWNHGEERETASVAFESSPSCIAFRPASNSITGIDIIAVSLADHSIRILENNEIKRMSAMQGQADMTEYLSSIFVENVVLKDHVDSVNSICFSRDGALLASASDDRTIRIWNMNTSTLPELTVTLRGHEGAVNSVSFSPDSRRLASASTDGTIMIWDPHSGAQLGVLRGDSGPVHITAFGPDSNWLASTCTDKTTILWSLEEEFRQGLRLPNNPGKHDAIDFSVDGRYFASAWGKDVRFWQASELVSESTRNLSRT